MGTLQYAWRTALELLEEALFSRFNSTIFVGNERGVFHLNVFANQTNKVFSMWGLLFQKTTNPK